MILTEEYLQQLYDQASAQVDLPAGCGVLLEGSIAEGFGNSGSDVDFLVIAAGEDDFPTMPTILFVDGHRVEIRIRSVAQVEQQVSEVFGGRISEDQLNRCQRLGNGLVLRHRELVEPVRHRLTGAEFETRVIGWFGRHAVQGARQATALLALQQFTDAAIWAGKALIDAAKSWAAAQGETYIERKWLPQQLARINDKHGDEQAVIADMWTLNGSRPAGEPTAEDVTKSLRLARRFGLADGDLDPDRISLARQRNVTTWRIGGRVHVIRNREEVFVLGEEAARTWRSLVFDRPLPVLVASLPAGAGSAAHIARFQRLGLVRFQWQGDSRSGRTPIAGGPATTPPPSAARPLLGLEGAACPADEPITFVPLPARRFAAAGMDFIWANLLVENCREDLVGALDSGQWRVAEIVGRRMLRNACLGVLSAYGVNPLPLRREAVARLQELSGLDAKIRRDAATLDAGLRVDSPESGQHVLARLDELARRMREAMAASTFPSCFDSAQTWQDTLEIGYEWIRLGAHVDASFPIEEARDLLAQGGRRYNPAPAGKDG